MQGFFSMLQHTCVAMKYVLLICTNQPYGTFYGICDVYINNKMLPSKVMWNLKSTGTMLKAMFIYAHTEISTLHHN